MRWITGILFSLFTLALSAQDEYPNILERDSFPGVKSLEISGYLQQFGENMDTILIPLTQSGFTFNESGEWITRAGVFPDGDVTFDSTWYDAKTRTKYIRSANDFEPSLTTITYNAKGKVLSELYAPEQRDQLLTEYEYDKSGRLIRKSIIFDDQKSFEEFAYDKKGNLVKKKSCRSSSTRTDSDLDVESFYTYNSSGKCDRMIELFYGKPDSVRSRDTVWYEYDASGRLIKQEESRQNGESKARISYKYDDKGRVLKREYFYENKNGTTSRVITKASYDEQGYCHVFSDEGDDYGFVLRWETTYNEKGLPVSCCYTTESEIIMYKWEYVNR